MLAYIPKIFAAYRQVKRRLHTVLEHLVAHADRSGRCWPSSRTLAGLIGDISKSTVARYLNELVRDGHAIRERERVPGGGWRFVYTVAAQFLPAARDKGGVPKPGRAVSQNARTEEKTFKKKEAPPVLTDDSAQWDRRLRSWRNSGGRFWNSFWGPSPDQPDCWAPRELLARNGTR